SANTRHACCCCPMATRVGCLRAGRLPSGIYLLLEDRGRLERQNAASRDACWLAGLRIAAQALFLLAHHERTARAQLHRLAALHRGGDSFDDLGDKHLGFVTGKPDSAMYRVRQYLTINGFSHSSASPMAPHSAVAAEIWSRGWVTAVIATCQELTPAAS